MVKYWPASPPRYVLNTALSFLRRSIILIALLLYQRFWEYLQLTAKGRALDTHGEDYSSTEDSAISSDHLSRHPSTDSLNRFSMANQSGIHFFLLF